MSMFKALGAALARWQAYLSGERFVIVIPRNATVFEGIRLRRGYEQSEQQRVLNNERLSWRAVRRQSHSLLTYRKWMAVHGYVGEPGTAHVPCEGWFLFGRIPIYKRIQCGDKHYYE
jgi:hypothetical protein